MSSTRRDAASEPTTSGDRSQPELVERLLARDDRAWRHFMTRYRGLVVATTRRVTHNFRGRYPIEDDEVFGALLSSLLANDMQKLRSFDPSRGASFSSWIGMLTAHVAWDFLRDLRRRSALDDRARQHFLGRYEADFGVRMIFREQCVRVARAREGLSRNDKRFFDMFYLDCAEAGEVATAMRISVKTVYTKNHKVRSKLRRALDDEASADGAGRMTSA
jgi:RNA polymerase sigma-70 factor (ECF subfamily)